jgi:hypothetical protein
MKASVGGVGLAWDMAKQGQTPLGIVADDPRTALAVGPARRKIWSQPTRPRVAIQSEFLVRLTLFFDGCPQSDHAMSLRLPIVPALLGLGLALTQAPTALWAQQGPGLGPRLTPQQKQQIFPEQKRLWLQHSRARISGLQTAERCVQAAQTADAFKSCLQRERQSNMESRRSHWSAMRALFSRYGIEMPERRERRGGPGAPAGAET